MPESWTSIEDAIGDIRKYCVAILTTTNYTSYNKLRGLSYLYVLLYLVLCPTQTPLFNSGPDSLSAT